MAQANPAKIARTAKNKETRALRHTMRMAKQDNKRPLLERDTGPNVRVDITVPRGSARKGRVLKAIVPSFNIIYKTPMREAFENLTVSKGFNDVAIAGNIFYALQKKIAPGMYPIPSVSINLTHATAKRLNAPHYDVKDFSKAANFNPMV